MAIIETAGALRPGTINTPLDQRSRVTTLAEISTLSLPYLGQIVYCVETDRYYKVTALKSTRIGALTVADAAVDAYEELPVTPAELQSLIVTQITNNPTILTFLEELIAARIADSGDSGDTGEQLPYTYPENVTPTRLILNIPSECYFYGETTEDPEHQWSDDDVLSVSVTDASGQIIAYDGEAIVTPPFTYRTAGSRCAVYCNSFGHSHIVKWSNSAGIVKEESILSSSNHIPRYFTRPSGAGNWQFKLDSNIVACEVWNGTAWEDFPSEGLGEAFAGCYIRPKEDPGQNSAHLACWSCNNIDGDQFLYLV